MRQFTAVTMGLAIAAIAASIAADDSTAAVAARAATPVAVELFTSQGCSSCPPADALAEQLAKEPNIVVLTRPVTYWDRLGWKDTLAREANTDLQREYATRGHSGAGVYTPQIVIQGTNAAIGSRQTEVRGLIAVEQSRPGPAVRAVLTKAGGRTVTMTSANPVKGAVWVAALRSTVEVRIGSGENGGRTVRYTNVVIEETQVGRIDGVAATITVPAITVNRAGADRYAILVRQGSAGKSVAVRYI